MENSLSHEAAAWALEKMLETFPDHGPAHHDLGRLYRQQGDMERACIHLKKAAALKPGDTLFQKSLADLFYKDLNRMDDALKIYLGILAAHPTDIETLRIMTDICITLKRFANARSFCHRMLAMEPWDETARTLLDTITARETGAEPSGPHDKHVDPAQTPGPADTGADADSPYKGLRILLCVASSGKRNHPLTLRILEEYAAMPFDTHAIVRGTEAIDYPPELFEKIKINHIRHPRSEGYRLTFFHRCDVLCFQHDYDLFIYTEHDQLITRQNIEAYLTVTRKLPEDVIPGLLRYAYPPKGSLDVPDKYLIDLFEHQGFDPAGSIADPWIDINGVRYFATKNRHQGCWLLTRDQLKRAIASDGFVCAWHGGPYGVSEQACSDPYTQCGFRLKVIPHDNLDLFLTHHLPERYTQTAMPLTMLKSYLGSIPKPTADR